MSQNRERLLLVSEILKRDTNIDHPATSSEIINKLKAEGITADRRSIYEDIRTLIDRGYDICTYEENNRGYYLRETEFEFSELRLLTDAVLSARFISTAQSKEIVNKLKKLTNRYDESRLEKVSYLHKRIKCDNRAIFYNIDMLTEAIEKGRQVSFDYLKYTPARKMEKKDDQKRVVSPYSIIWVGDYYYLVCKYPKYESLSNLRLEKISNITILDEPAELVTGIAGFENGFDIAEYANRHIHMFSGREERIELRCREEILQAMQDKFGEELKIKKQEGDYFWANVRTVRQGMLYFVLQMADGIEVLSPPDFREEVAGMLRKILNQYTAD